MAATLLSGVLRHGGGSTTSWQPHLHDPEAVVSGGGRRRGRGSPSSSSSVRGRSRALVARVDDELEHALAVTDVVDPEAVEVLKR
jgi:hypothetical protein